MPLDAVFLTALTRELNESLPGARIDKIQQPERDTVLLQLRSPAAGNRRLLLSASPNHPRLHYTEARWENPAQPPMFCMLLRKHLAGGRVISLRQLPMERAVDLCVESADELGELSQKHLLLELMGRNSNLILTGPDGRIIDCLRRVDFEMSEKRQVLPGLHRGYSRQADLRCRQAVVCRSDCRRRLRKVHAYPQILEFPQQ